MFPCDSHRDIRGVFDPRQPGADLGLRLRVEPELRQIHSERDAAPPARGNRR